MYIYIYIDIERDMYLYTNVQIYRHLRTSALNIRVRQDELRATRTSFRESEREREKYYNAI